MGYVRLVKRRYPFDALSRARKCETGERARAKAALTEEREQADRRATDAAAVKTLEEKRLREALDAEGKRLEAGLARAADLVQSERFRRRATSRIREQEEVRLSAETQAAAASRKEQIATSALRAAHDAEKAVREHRAAFRARENRASERREENAGDDAWRSRRGRRGEGVE